MFPFKKRQPKQTQSSQLTPLPFAFKAFCKRMTGKQIRSMTADGFHLVVDDCGPDRSVRFLLYAHFHRTYDSLEDCIIGIFNRDPTDALMITTDYATFIGKLTGNIPLEDGDWVLSDEECQCEQCVEMREKMRKEMEKMEDRENRKGW